MFFLLLFFFNIIVIIIVANYCPYLEGVERLGEDGTVVVVVADGDGDTGGCRVDAVVRRDNQLVLVLLLSVQWYGGNDSTCKGGVSLNNSESNQISL